MQQKQMDSSDTTGVDAAEQASDCMRQLRETSQGW